MIETLNQQELIAAKGIIKLGLDKAAESLSFFMKDKIGISDFELVAAPNQAENEYTSKNGEQIHLLTTEIIGELSGICCLIFNKEEVSHVLQSSLPASVLSNPEKLNMMGNAFLLEVDNIISASVITQFSNILEHKMHGDVPNLKVFNENELNDFISHHLNKESQIINFKINFTSSHMHFCPEFFWLFDKSFIDAIIKFGSKIENLEKYKFI